MSGTRSSSTTSAFISQPAPARLSAEMDSGLCPVSSSNCSRALRRIVIADIAVARLDRRSPVPAVPWSSSVFLRVRGFSLIRHISASGAVPVDDVSPQSGRNPGGYPTATAKTRNMPPSRPAPADCPHPPG